MTDPLRALRLATWNVEWFNALFDDAGQLLADGAPSSRYGVSRADQAAGIAAVMVALNADGMILIEAPDQSRQRSTVTALENFAAAAGLRTRRALVGFKSDTEQEIAFLYDPDVILARHDPMESPRAPRFDRVFHVDLDEDGAAEPIRFSKPPLEIALTARGRDLRLIGVHAKSKGGHGAKSESEFIRQSIDNRRKQLAECRWIRARADQVLAAGQDLIVLGDLNDGPGIDAFEAHFGQSGVEVVMAPTAPAALQLFDPHAAGQKDSAPKPAANSPTTARFWLGPEDRYFEALLDYIMVSEGLRARARWRICHPVQDATIAAQPAFVAALRAASDHYPVVLDLG